MYGLVHIPAKIVEPLIALWIAYVAIGNLFTSELKSCDAALVLASCAGSFAGDHQHCFLLNVGHPLPRGRGNKRHVTCRPFPEGPPPCSGDFYTANGFTVVWWLLAYSRSQPM